MRQSRPDYGLGVGNLAGESLGERLDTLWKCSILDVERSAADERGIQGYLAHKKPPPPLGPP